ncbi:ISAs1 family transposase [Aquimarina sp. 2201CG1-2-11]|uniref:ISAs1 family transposase n=1 Tax=Aquimarina discodermiae TaxID=3231043 RepID=UPI003461FF22
METRRTNKGNLQHTFYDILLIVLVSALCGLEKYSLMVQFAKNELEWFKKYVEFHNGIPSSETIRRFLTVLDTAAFQECYSNWIGSLCDLDEVQSIVIDGKTIRGASTKSNPNSISLHILTVWASELGIALVQLRVDDKSNEITAIPELIKKLVVKGSVFTIDAMGCQKDIVSEITSHQADYIIAVKGNQKSLEIAIKDTALLEKPDDVSVKEDIGHGRVEKRTCSIYRGLSHLYPKNSWQGLKQFVRIES